MWEMMVDHHNILIPLVSSLLMLVLGPLIIDVMSVGRKIGRFLRAIARFLAHDDSVVVVTDDDSLILLNGDNPPPPTCDDDAAAAAVMARLGLSSRGRSGVVAMDMECQGCDTMDVVDELLDRKMVSERELEEAFCVFDRNEDGFISAAELWSVMRRLGFQEGERYEDCMRMICTFDEDRDGRISYSEFRRMMEDAV
ncbi:hypothetical protein ABZP36_002207 [Zizania latifolia]